MAVKARNVFALKDFRGLDKENKLLKVAPYRATDGYNFKIDSNVLKTRPSITIDTEPPFIMTSGNYIIEMYEYNGVDIYITKNGFFFYPKNDTFQNVAFFHDGQGVVFSSPSVYLNGGIAASFDFSLKRPLFQEEKECLFIFGLDNIYVFSVIRGNTTIGLKTKYVFYELRSKPSTPSEYLNNEEYRKIYQDLPTPYVPTVILDNNPLDDVNLLSNQSYYKFFAAEPSLSTRETTYYLPTYYDKEKHGVIDFNNQIQLDNLVKVEFYKGRYENYTTFPVFLGIKEENFFTGASTVATLYGTEITGSSIGDGKNNNFKQIQDTFFALKKFQYIGKPNQSPTSVEKIVGLTKNAFFEMIVKDTGNKTVFEYLMDYIKINASTLTANRHVAFSLRVQYTAEYRDLNTDFLTDVSVHESTFNVFVQLKSDEVTEVKLNNEKVYSATNSSTVIGDQYPSYPTVNETPTGTVLTLGANPILITNNSASASDTFKELAQTKILQDETQYANGHIMRVNAQLYKILQQNQVKEVVLPSKSSTGNTFVNNSGSYSTGFYSPPNNVSPPPLTSDYPTVNFPTAIIGIPQIDLGINNEFYTTTTTFTFGSGTGERTSLLDSILAVIDGNQDIANTAVNGAGQAWFRTRLFKRIYAGQSQFGFPLYNYSTATVLVFVSYKRTQTVNVYERYSMSFTCTVNETTQPIETVLFTKKFNEEDNTVELTVKNYFYDYNNEPSILVTLTFPQNKDYNLISESKFGINFGSENRLFLAGNPNYKHIDRYNVSNDLLGNGVKSQSYELTYFPSKNYRVVGGKGAINGYVVATDTQLYVTKEEYPNDNKLFVRQRSVDQAGAVSYFDVKTNIDKTPLNNRCIVRFYNDIVILDKNGLYAIELSQNVLTDERLVKLRSGFINEELKAKIKGYDNSKIFITENNIELHIYINKDIYVADSKYIAQNPNSSAENVSYEIVKWEVPITFVSGTVKNGDIKIYPSEALYIYKYDTKNYDEVFKRVTVGNISIVSPITLISGVSFQAFTINSSLIPKSTTNATINNLALTFQTPLYKVVGIQGVDHTYTSSTQTFNILKSSSFANLTNGSKVYIDGSDAGFNFLEFTISNFEETQRTAFNFTETITNSANYNLYQDVTNEKLYITHYYWFSSQASNQTQNNDLVLFFRLSPYKPANGAITITRSGNETDDAYKTRFNALFTGANLDNNVYYRPASVSTYEARLIEDNQINVRWVSAITDFGLSTMEKTSFRVNIYATKQQDTNSMTFGFRTLRRLAGLSNVIDLSNNFNLENVEYSQFSLATFNTLSMSVPMKENNFLYIQFVVNGYGKIELNGIEVVFKANRMLRSVN